MNTKLTATIAIAVVAMMVFSTAGATTLSWFTDTEETDITITTGKLDVATSNFFVDLPVVTDYESKTVPNKFAIVYDDSRNGNTQWIDNKLLVAGNPDDVGVTIKYNVTFSGDIDYKYFVGVDYTCGLGINVSVKDDSGNDVELGKWIENNSQDMDSFSFTHQVEIKINSLPEDLSEGSEGFIKIVNKITQYLDTSDPPFMDTWDGTADTSWYDSEDPKGAYVISTAEQFLGLSELVAGDTTFAGVTFTLTDNLDLYCEDTSENADGDPLTFRPIGDKSKNGTFEGTFDGNGHTISNLYQNGWDLGYEWGAYGSYGLFGKINDATIKNLTIVGTESYIEGGDVSFIAGSATGDCIFENITIKDSTIATYNNGCGGIIGWSGAGNYTFKNIIIGEDVVLGGLWGSFDSSIGGIVGQAEPGATYNFENVTVNCRLDAYNDCTASNDYYNYRMCGMLIGRCEEFTTIDGVIYPDISKYNLTFNNVTVNYGAWMNYHYCEPTPGNMNGGRGMRVEAGYAYDGLPEDYDHTQCVNNHYNCIPFDQLIGGKQYGARGLKAVDGVTVYYPDEYTCDLCGEQHNVKS